MSLEEVRERNIALVIEKALKCFTERGIEHTKVKDIAREAGLTERSVFRYFPTKTDLIQAAAFLLWSNTLETVEEKFQRMQPQNLSGIEQLQGLLQLYAQYFLDNPQLTRFSLDAEIALYNAGRKEQALRRPPENYETSDSPMVKVIRRGLADGTIKPRYDPKELYYNAYDSVLGVLQRISVQTTSTTDLDSATRMKHLCEIFVSQCRGD